MVSIWKPDDIKNNDKSLNYKKVCKYHLIFICRLLNPKVVHACTLVLTDWEDIPTAALKAAVTILHRIAVGSKMPALLFQVSIQRKFYI